LGLADRCSSYGHPWYEILIVLGINAFGLKGYLLLSALLFVYWTSLEGYRGQSLGKMFLNIVVTGPLGESITFRDAAVESFGKSFLLPFDGLVAWLLLERPGSVYSTRYPIPLSSTKGCSQKKAKNEGI